MDSFTLTLSGHSSELEAFYYPPIELSANKQYALGLVQLFTYNSIPNVNRGNNTFEVPSQFIVIPPGGYEVEDIEEFLRKKNVNIEIKVNKNTQKCTILCDESIDFTQSDSIGSLLGFKNRFLREKIKHESDFPVTITKVNAIRVECNITTNAFMNNERVRTIHEFYPDVPIGFKLIEEQTNVIYLPITVRAIDHLQIRLIDQNNKLVDFREEPITIRLHVKSL